MAARVDDSVAADFDDSKSKKRVYTPRLFFWWRKAKKSRDVVALSIVFLLTFFLSYSLTSSSSSSSFESNSFGPAVQRGLALRKKFAEQSAASSNHAYRYSNSHHALEYSTRRQLLATAYPEIDEFHLQTTCSVTGESYVVQVPIPRETLALEVCVFVLCDGGDLLAVQQDDGAQFRVCNARDVG